VRGFAFMRGEGDGVESAAASERVPDRVTTSADVLGWKDRGGRAARLDLGRTLRRAIEVTDWAPMVGALPAPAGTGPGPEGALPLMVGVTGLWR